MSKLYVEKTDIDSRLPVKAHSSDAGYDVYAHSVKRVYIHAGSNNETVIDFSKTMNDNEKRVAREKFEGKTLRLQYLERALIGTGIKATIEDGWEIQVRSRSGLALKQGLIVANQPGTIDAGYRDEIGVIILNTSRKAQEITLGDRIAQLVPKQVDNLVIEEVSKLPEAKERGEAGFGSTGLAAQSGEIKRE